MNRILYIEWLRLIATIGVVMIHVSGIVMSANVLEQASKWMSGNFYETIARFAVPIFVMISGALLLNDSRKLTYKQFFLRRISKVAIPLIGWSVIYYAYNYYRGNLAFSIGDLITRVLTNGIGYQFWFLYMLLGLYLVTPLVKILVEHATKKDVGYFLLLWFYATVGVKLFNHFIGFSPSIEMYFVTNYIGYFILGYYLSKYDISLMWRKLSYLGIGIGMLATFSLTYASTIRSKGAVLNEFWYDYLSFNVVLVSVGLFILFKYRATTLQLPLVFTSINKASLGIYLLHMLILDMLYQSVFGVVFTNLHPMLAIPLNAMALVCICAIIILIIKKIPVLKRISP